LDRFSAGPQGEGAAFQPGYQHVPPPPPPGAGAVAGEAEAFLSSLGGGTQQVPPPPPAPGGGQGLALVHFSAQLEPFLTQENTLHNLNAT